MMSNPRTQTPSPRTATPPSTPANAYRPSVPISIYRQLASELQIAQEQLNTVKTQNQQLLQQNQRLRQETERLYHSAQKLHQIATANDPYGKPLELSPPLDFGKPQPIIERQTEPPLPLPKPESIPPKQKWVAEVEEKASRRPRQTQTNSDVSGWLLLISVVLIILIAFGMGFLVMRPLLNNKR
ncbi:hypothetical protein IQ249_22995 [Lusitaniella coriacea LEGE 07157]|uniref:Uncharacterized protein n=1 Tax=Lusitaniella coriacea LEGE 07157 TaxID=945747 RepID=A0A8J7E0G3_9CYAN|nr:hypothetical protein [Lusitaniella coriacea]MBE9118760.1 hypothetical protein [Lusitaniella coriacea LEGE 07157]